MDQLQNPFTPGAGSRPYELVGRRELIGESMKRMKTREVKDNLYMVLRLLREGKEDRIVICTGDIPVAEIRLYRETPTRFFNRCRGTPR